MTTPLSEFGIIRAVAEQAAARVARKVIRNLQRMHHKLSGEDTEVRTTWDEICVQVQYEYSYYWDVYDETVRSLLAVYVEKLAEYEREALWLQSDAGF